MMYYIGQFFGLLSTALCLILPFFPQKWQMLVVTGMVNALCGLNLIFIGRVGSVILIYVVAVIQIFAALRHLKRDTDPSRLENMIFLLLYVVCGSLDLRGVIDILPVVGSVFHMLATFQKDVGKTRVLLLFNAGTFLSYYILVRSTAGFACVCTLTTTLAAMYKYRKVEK